jgi:hypothetical protein
LTGFILSLFALRRVKRRGTSGRGLAIAGLVLSVVGVLLFVAFAVAISSDWLEEEPVTVADVVPGECINRQGAANITKAACDLPHDSEVYAVLVGEEVGFGDYPGRRELEETAGRACEERFAEYVGIPYDDSELASRPLVPTRLSWEAGDRRVVCLAEQLDRTPLFSSVRNKRV